MKDTIKLFSLVFIPIALLSCNSKSASLVAASQISNTAVMETTASTQPDTTQHISFNAVRLNGKIPLLGTKQAFFNLLGQPDSIVPVDLEDACGYFFYLDSNYSSATCRASALKSWEIRRL